jgi:serine/threonine protein phosphatase 1
MKLVIADLHGRADLLAGLIDHTPAEASFVFVGDAIDRGPRNRDTIKLLMQLADAGRMTLLRGNHEGIVLDVDAAYERFVASEGEMREVRGRDALSYFQSWQANGGDVVVREYGGWDADGTGTGASDGFGLWGVPPELMNYIAQTKYLYHHSCGPAAGGDIFVSHAAPPLRLANYHSLEETMLWARPEEGPWPLPPGVRLSVHGHTPVRAPTRLGQHLFIDLGAVWTGALCTFDLESEKLVVFHKPGGAPLASLAAFEEVNGIKPEELAFETVVI